MQEGWVCPKCGRVNAPFVDHCPCSSIDNIKVNPIPYYPYPYVQPYIPWDGHLKVTCDSCNKTENKGD